MILQPDDLLKLLLAVLVGGVIGAEREFRDKAAGFRTLIFICVGSAMFAIVALRLGTVSDATRIMANIVTGVGFLGAGAILRDGNRIGGLTTAATVWMVSALGMGIGAGEYLIVGAATATILLVLWLFPMLEDVIDRARESRVYEVTTGPDLGALAALEDRARGTGVTVRRTRLAHSGNEIVAAWAVYGLPTRQQQLVQLLFDDPDVHSFRY